MEELRQPTTSDPRLINNNRLEVIRKEALLPCRVLNDQFIGNVLARWLSAWFSSLSFLPSLFFYLFVQLCCVRLFLSSLLSNRLLYFIYSLLVYSKCTYSFLQYAFPSIILLPIPQLHSLPFSVWPFTGEVNIIGIAVITRWSPRDFLFITKSVLIQEVTAILATGEKTVSFTFIYSGNSRLEYLFETAL